MAGTRQRIFLKKIKTLCRVPVGLALGKEIFQKKLKLFAECRDFSESLTLDKVLVFAECNSLPSAALGKEGLCRVSDF